MMLNLDINIVCSDLRLIAGECQCKIRNVCGRHGTALVVSIIGIQQRVEPRRQDCKQEPAAGGNNNVTSGNDSEL